jgi:hypothetical protein
MRYTAVCLLGLVLLSLSLQPCSSQEASQGGGPAAALNPRRSEKPAPPDPFKKEDLNAWTVGVAGGLLEGTFIRYAADLAKALDVEPQQVVLGQSEAGDGRF